MRGSVFPLIRKRTERNGKDQELQRKKKTEEHKSSRKVQKTSSAKKKAKDREMKAEHRFTRAVTQTDLIKTYRMCNLIAGVCPRCTLAVIPGISYVR